MIKVHPKYVYDEKDKKVGVVLSLDDFEHLIDELEDLHDFKLINKRKASKEKVYTLEQVKAELFGKK